VISQTPEQRQKVNIWVEKLDMNMSDRGTDYDDLRNVLMAEWVAENMHIDPESVEAENAYRDIGRQAFTLSLQGSLTDIAKKTAGVAQQGGSDFLHVATSLPIQNYLGDWVEAGEIPDSLRDSIMLGIGLVESGEATIEQRRILGNQIGDVLRRVPRTESTRFFSQNLGAVINLVSTREVDVLALPDDIETGIIGDRIAARDDEGFDLRQRGRTEGWYVRRDQYQIDVDVGHAAERVTKNRLRDIYEETTGLAWGDNRDIAMEIEVPIGPEFWEKNGAFVPQGRMQAARLRYCLINFNMMSGSGCSFPIPRTPSGRI